MVSAFAYRGPDLPRGCLSCVPHARGEVLRIAHWSLTTLREKLIKIGAKFVRHGRSIVFQMAEVAVPRSLFAEVLHLIDGLRPRPAPSSRFSFPEDARREGNVAP